MAAKWDFGMISGILLFDEPVRMLESLAVISEDLKL